MIKQHNKISLIGVIIILSVGIVSAQPPDTLWTRTYGGTQEDRGSSVQQTSDDGYIIAGTTWSFGSGPPTHPNFYLIKTDTNGDTLWTKAYGDTNGEFGYSVQQTADGGYIIAGYTQPHPGDSADFYLIKTDTNGDSLWARKYGGTLHDKANTVEQTSDGGYIIVGYTESFGAGSEDVYLIKTDSGGNTLWTRTFGGTDSDKGYDVKQTADGKYIVAGFKSTPGDFNDVWLLKIDTNGDTLWTKTYGDSQPHAGYSVQQTSDGGYIIAGNKRIMSTADENFYLVKTDANGDSLWAKSYGGANDDFCGMVRQTLDGGYIIVGRTKVGGTDFDGYIIRTDSVGDTTWTMKLGGSEGDACYSIEQTSDNGYIVVGDTESSGAGFIDVWLIKLGPEIGVEEDLNQSVFYISNIGPNPFKDRITINYGLLKSSHVRIVIYNTLGQQVRTLVNNKEGKGQHTLTWNGRDRAGKEVSGGVYFLRLETAEYSTTRKILLAK